MSEASPAAEHSDVLILGGGAIGLSCAYCLLQAGASVRVLEQSHVGAGSSHGNCGTLTPSHAEPLCEPGMVGKALHWMLKRDAPLYVSPRPDLKRLRWLLGFARHCNRRDEAHAVDARVAILKRSLVLTESWVREDELDCEFARDGLLYVYADQRQLEADREHVERLQTLDIPVEYRTREEMSAMEPALRDDLAGGIFHPGDARIRPDRYVTELARRVRELGGVIDEHTPVERLATARGRITHAVTSKGEFSGDRVVLATGAWSPLIAEQLGLKLPMQPGKGYSITYSRPDPCPHTPMVFQEPSVCVTSWGSGFRLGSTMEFSGYDKRLNETRLHALEEGAARYLRQPVGDEVQEKWWGWRPMSVDEIPIIGPSSRFSNLMHATGHGMMGMSMSAATGELVASLCRGNEPTLDAAPYSPARFKV